MKVMIDLQSLLNSKINQETTTIIRYKPRHGALGAVTVLSEVFDLYLLNKYSSLNTEAIMKWLEMAQIDKSFRNIITVDENLKEFYLQNGINVTIISDSELLEKVKDISNTYWLLDVHTKDIQDQILKMISWHDIIRDVTKFATTDNYEFRYNKK